MLGFFSTVMNGIGVIIGLVAIYLGFFADMTTAGIITAFPAAMFLYFGESLEKKAKAKKTEKEAAKQSQGVSKVGLFGALIGTYAAVKANKKQAHISFINDHNTDAPILSANIVSRSRGGHTVHYRVSYVVPIAPNPAEVLGSCDYQGQDRVESRHAGGLVIIEWL